MPKILIVDDSKVDQQLAGALVRDRADLTVLFADNGRSAMDVVERDDPSVVVTDLMMPEMNGLELVAAIRRTRPAVPVVLMTAHGSEEVAAEALRTGAASYVPKKYLARDLVATLNEVLALAADVPDVGSVSEWLAATEWQFVVDNDSSKFHLLTGYFQSEVKRLKLLEQADVVRVGTAVGEALTNALLHGNLDIPSVLKESDMDAYRRLLVERSNMAPYRDRRIHVTGRFTRTEATYVIRDEGEGFDPSSTPDPTDPLNLTRLSGRGLLLIRTFMDDVHHNESGNEITMTKRRRT